tara:strand:+ start:929 stop:1657 length:729 start_codon:yes stop_codon:yes gene_type:complete
LAAQPKPLLTPTIIMIKDNYKVQSIKSQETYDWLLHKHYAKRIPSISYAFGLYKDKILEGVCTFGSPASAGLVKSLGREKNNKNVYELNRLCVNNQNIENVTSYFLSKCLKLLPKPKILVSFADSGQNHNGYIYQATNWTYTGLSDKHIFWDLVDLKNTKQHDRHKWDSYGGIENAKKILKDKMIAVQRPRKHRYIYLLGNKKFKKENMNIFKGKYSIKPYPKGENKRYDASYKPSTQGLLF